MSEMCRPLRRLFLCVLVLLVPGGLAQTVPMTTVQDTVYRADGTPAEGTLLISWPAFTTAAGQAIAAGTTSVNLGPGGALSVSLVPNANATPANTVYTVVYQLDDGTVKTEYWVVPTTSPTTLAAVRTTLGATTSVAQMATQQYVNSALATKANDSAVVHLANTETITGTKQFSVSPSMPTPSQPTDAVNKAYVDSSVQNVGSGSYLSTSGGTLTGPLTLSGDPVAPNQASTKHYVDISSSVKADLIGGLVPATELGSGTPGPNTCLLGNQTWGTCGAGGNSSYINSELVASPNFNSSMPAAQNNFLNCSFQNTDSNVTLQCPYGNTSSTFALGSQAVLNNNANTYGPGLQDFSAASLKLPNGPGYAPGMAGAVGFDTTANMPVINVSGVTQQLALTTSNISGQANTALALAATPAQCNGSFATGIQANGNANCTTADVLQLAETTQPAGIPNYGIFWFDSATHTPRVIDNNGQVVQLGLMNVFNTNANTLEEYNGTTPQTFNVYGTRTDAADYERLRLAYDATDGYFFVGSDAAGTGTQQGLGLWLQGGLRWVVDESFTFKPWADNLKDIGTSTLRVRNLYLGTGLVFNSGTLSGVHGTTGVAAEAGTLGTTTGAGLCNDGNGNVTDQGCTLGAVSSVFGRSGVVVPQSGDYSVAQVTGAAPLASPAFTGTPTAPTQSALDNSTKIATTGYTDSAVGVEETRAQAAEALLAPLASPAFTGVATAPTPATSDSSAKIATTAWVNAQGYGTSSGNVSGPASSVSGDIATYNGTTGKSIQDSGLAASSLAPLASPAFTGTPTAPTPAIGDNSTKIATTAWAQSNFLYYAELNSPAFTGTPTAPTPLTSDNSTKIATTAWVYAQGYGSGGGGLSGLTASNTLFAKSSTQVYSSSGAMSVGAYMAANSLTDICQALRGLENTTGYHVLVDVQDANVGSNTFGGANNCAGQIFNSNATGKIEFTGRTVLTVSQPQEIPTSNALVSDTPLSTSTRLDTFGGVKIAACNPLYQPCPLGAFSAPNVSYTAVSCTAYGSVYYCTITLSGAFPSYPSGVNLSGPRIGRFVQLVAANGGPSGDVVAGATGANGGFYILGASGTPGSFTQAADTSTSLIVASYTNLAANCGSSCTGTAYLETPLAYTRNGSGTGRNYEIQIKSILFDAQYMPGVVPFENIGSEEGTILEDVGFYNSTFLWYRNHIGTCTAWTGAICHDAGASLANAFGVNYGGATNSGPNFAISINSGPVDCQISTGCGTATNGTHTMTPNNISQNPDPVSPIEIGGLWDGPGVGNATRPTICGTASTFNAEATIVTGYIISGISTGLIGCHEEEITTSVLVGGSVAVTGTFPGAPTYGVHVTGGFIAGSGGDYAVEIGATENNLMSGAVNPVTSVEILDTGGSSNASSTTTVSVRDRINGLLVSCANARGGYVYMLGSAGAVEDLTGCSGYNLYAPSGVNLVGGGLVAGTSDTSVDTGLFRDSADVWDMGNGTSKDKTATLNLGQVNASVGITSVTPSAGDNSTKVATTAYVQGQTTGIPWLTVPRGGSVSGVTFSSTANQAALWGVVLTFPVTTTQVTYYVGTSDNTSDTYDIGIYDNSGNLKAHTGATAGTAFAPAAGSKTLSWTGGAVTLQPGRYYLAITTNCTASCAALDGDNASAVTFQSRGIISVTSGGTLNGPITPPADAWSWASYTPAWVVH